MTSKHIKPIATWTRQARDAQRNKDNRMCIDCWIEKAVTKCRCRKCQDKQNEYARRRYHERILQGLCVKCGKPCEKGYKYHNRNECVPSRRIVL